LKNWSRTGWLKPRLIQRKILRSNE
jgi:hypothetical protein